MRNALIVLRPNLSFSNRLTGEETLTDFISVIKQLDAQNCFTISFISCLYVFRAHLLIIRRSKLHYTASGIHHNYRWPTRAQVQTSPLSQPAHRTATYWCDDTRGCVLQFWPPDDEHMCSKHVEVWNKLIIKQKFCASSWLITEINILRCTVSKMSKKLKDLSPETWQRVIW